MDLKWTPTRALRFTTRTEVYIPLSLPSLSSSLFLLYHH
jgi:hypothetical protein